MDVLTESRNPTRCPVDLLFIAVGNADFSGIKNVLSFVFGLLSVVIMQIQLKLQ